MEAIYGLKLSAGFVIMVVDCSFFIWLDCLIFTVFISRIQPWIGIVDTYCCESISVALKVFQKKKIVFQGPFFDSRSFSLVTPPPLMKWRFHFKFSNIFTYPYSFFYIFFFKKERLLMMYNQNFSLRIDSLTFQIGQFQGSISHVHTLLLSRCEHISKCSGPALKSSIKRHLKCSSCIVLMTCISVYIIIFKIFLIYNSQHILI